MNIIWTRVQGRLGLTPDGIPGRNTYAALLTAVAPNADDDVIRSLANACVVHFPAYGVDASPDRLADFLAQTANETGSYEDFHENLNYSADGLARTWPNRYAVDPKAKTKVPNGLAMKLARKPQEIAMATYGDRMGNLKPEEGWTFRGRGMLQLTGRANYEAADRRLGIGLDTNPDLAAVPALSLLIACNFYRQNKVFAALDRGDTTGARKITNGGTIGLDHVNTLRRKLLDLLV